MRKSAFIFALFYLLNVVGYGVEVHYCLGRVADVNYAFLDTTCACEALEESRGYVGCCDHESFFVQLDTDHQASSKVDVNIPDITLVRDIFEVYALDQEISISSDGIALRAPPLRLVDRVIEYRSLILYA